MLPIETEDASAVRNCIKAFRWSYAPCFVDISCPLQGADACMDDASDDSSTLYETDEFRMYCYKVRMDRPGQIGGHMICVSGLHTLP